MASSPPPPPYTEKPSISSTIPAQAPPLPNRRPPSTSTTNTTTSSNSQKPSLASALKSNWTTLKKLQDKHLTALDVLYHHKIENRQIVPRRHRDGRLGAGEIVDEEDYGGWVRDREGKEEGVGGDVKGQEKVKGKWWRRNAGVDGERDWGREDYELRRKGKEDEVDEREGEGAESDKLYIHEARDVLVEDENGDVVKEVEGDDYFGGAGGSGSAIGGVNGSRGGNYGGSQAVWVGERGQSSRAGGVRGAGA